MEPCGGGTKDNVGEPVGLLTVLFPLSWGKRRTGLRWEMKSCPFGSNLRARLGVHMETHPGQLETHVGTSDVSGCPAMALERVPGKGR